MFPSTTEPSLWGKSLDLTEDSFFEFSGGNTPLQLSTDSLGYKLIRFREVFGNLLKVTVRSRSAFWSIFLFPSLEDSYKESRKALDTEEIVILQR